MSEDFQQNNNQPVETVENNNTSGQGPKSNKKLALIIGGVIGLLLVAILILVIVLLSGKDDEGSGDSNDSTNSSQQTSSNSANTDREVLMRVPTENEKLEYVIYKPKQTASNTTMYFAIENVCDGCNESVSTYGYVNDFADESDSYLLDDNNGKKYSPITDQDGNVLATPDCSARLEFGEKQECFVAFSKVPSGSTVSWVFGDTRINGIKIE